MVFAVKVIQEIQVIGFVVVFPTGLDGAVVMSSANGLVGTGFASQYRLQHIAEF